MITIRDEKGRLERLTGNPTLTSLDGTQKAPLRTILHPSWSAAERAAFGVYLCTPATIPEGKRPVGEPHYERQGAVVVQVLDLEDIPPARDPITGPQGATVTARMHRFALAGDGHAAHRHDDKYQYTVVTRGGLLCDVEGVGPQEFYAPAIIEVASGLLHQMTALEDNTEFFCIFTEVAP